MTKTDFTKNLLEWHRTGNNRWMPWKGEPNPYRIWLSEIILQQTRVEQGLAYYEKFISAFPTIGDLAKAPEKEIFKNWEGLGYYSRCRNLIATAKIITNQYQGLFPSSYNELIGLPGIGPYTASAIASFAFGLPYAVVDGNVERVLARYFGMDTQAGTAQGKKIFAAAAFGLLDKKNPGTFNQAIMDFGAGICKPRNPACSVCVMAENCQAFLNGWTDRLPVKAKAVSRKTRWLYYFVVDAGDDRVWIRERVEKDIWQNLYEFVLWESGQITPQKNIAESRFVQDTFGDAGFNIQRISPAYSQTLTHQSIIGQFVHLNSPIAGLSGYQSVPRSRLHEFPFPKLITDYIKIIEDTGVW
jgi:A/G-specific adenine glycosylase